LNSKLAVLILFRFSLRALLLYGYTPFIMNQTKFIYMIAICGTGMSALAGLLKEAGHRVCGSDANIYPPVSTLLKNYGIEIKSGYKKENIPNFPDLVVVGNAVSRNNEEAQAIMERDIPFTSFPEALGKFFLQGRRSLVVAGTHGKTTTASLLAWILQECGEEPGFLIGGWLKNFDSNYRSPKGNYFVIEGDEYDTAFFDKGPKFLHYQPHAAIITGIEFDHADIYKDLEQIQLGFKKFAGLIPKNGFLLVEDSGTNLEGSITCARCPVETYGFTEEADWRITDFSHENGQSRFLLTNKKKNAGPFILPMMGKHNAQNATGAIAMAIKLGLGIETVAKALATFRGVKRRQEVVGEKNGVTVIDVFAHHPTAIHCTLEAVREAFPKRRIWAVFEPRSATSRRNTFQAAFSKSFQLADITIIAQLFAPEKIPPEKRLDLNRLLSELEKKGKEAYLIPEVEAIIEFIATQKRDGDVVLIMSSGGFSGIHQKLLNRL